MKNLFRCVFALSVLILVPERNADAQWVNGQAATAVIGQPDFSTYTYSTSDSTLDITGYEDGGVLYDPQHAKLYVFDSNNNRVLRFAYPPGGFTSNQPKAEAVLGQPNFSSQATAVNAHSMGGPIGGAILDDTLWVADELNSRILGFYNASTKATGDSADVVLGQPDFTSNEDLLTTAVNMSDPSGVAIDRETRDLYVADYSNARVLKFNHNNKSTGASADLVFGEADANSFAPATTQNGMQEPWKVLVYKNNLFVADYGNGRVLRYNNLHSISSDQPNASVVLGQADFTTHSTGLSDSLMTDPTGIAVDSTGRLYVAEYSNNRILIFPDALTNSNTPSATAVLGQTNFLSNAAASGPGQLNLGDEITIDAANSKVYVVDVSNNRVLQFTEGSAPLPVELVSFTASSQQGGVELQWRTATEVNSYGFEVERELTPSLALITPTQPSPFQGEDNWSRVAFVAGAGTSNSPQSYSLSDKTPAAGNYSYRLKQIDRNGAFQYSLEVEVTAGTPGTFALNQNYPNPFNPSTVISYQLAVNSYVSLKVYDVLGRETATLVNDVQDAGTKNVQWNGGAATGVYYYRLEAVSQSDPKSRFVDIKKMMIVR